MYEILVDGWPWWIPVPWGNEDMGPMGGYKQPLSKKCT
jgi:hypothetical protein